MTIQMIQAINLIHPRIQLMIRLRRRMNLWRQRPAVAANAIALAMPKPHSLP
jgi:hypothetical protein